VPDADALFVRIVERYRDDPLVTPPSQGRGGKFGGVKLPRQRVEELVAAGTGAALDPGHGRVMKEWVTVTPEHARLWPRRADEARQFVAGAK
jgi:hypothetical protein